MNKELLKYFDGDEFRASTWLNKYAARDSIGQPTETTPNDMHIRLAKEFARIEENYKWKINHDNAFSKISDQGLNLQQQLDYETIYNLFKNFKYVIPAGSVMATAGLKLPVSLSNCFVIESATDSINGINKTSTEQQNLMKRRGGVGHDVSTIRPRGSRVNNSANTSSGVVPFMNLYSEATNTIAQEGRRGALMLSISIDHPDSPEFIESKQDLTKITGANISVKVTDEFMNAVVNDGDYILRYPIDTEHLNEAIKETNILHETAPYDKLFEVNHTYEDGSKKNVCLKKIKAKDLWNKLMHCAWNTAEPGIIFEDRMINYSPDGVYPKYKFISTNPCVTKDTTLLTREGFIPIIDLIDKDVDIWNGFEWTKVKPFKTSDSADVYLVELSDGDSIKCTEYHKFILKDDIRKELKDIKIGDKLAKFEYPIIEGNSTYSDSLYKEFYTRGFFCGDGTIAKEDGRPDRYFIDLYDSKKELFKFLNAELYGSETDSKQRIILDSIYDKEYVPNENDNLKLRLAYLAGVIDSDGTLNDKDGSIAISSNNKDYLYKIKGLLVSLGCRSSISICKEAQIKNIKGIDYNCDDTNYKLIISAYYVKQLMNLGLITNRVELIANPNRNASRFVTVDKITKLENKEATYCVTDDKNHSAVFNHTMTGQCGEIPMQPYDSCRLIHVNLLSMIIDPYKPTSRLDEDLLFKVCYYATMLADDMIDLEIEAVSRIIEKIEKDEDQGEKELWCKIKDNAINGRRAGLGFTALADTIAALGYKFDSPKGIASIEHIMRIMFAAQLTATTDMAVTRGAFPDWDKELEKEGNEWYDFVKQCYPLQYEKMMKYGRRNISFSTVAPTGTVSIMAGTSSGIEPVFMPFYQRYRKCMSEHDQVDHIDAVGEKYTAFVVVHPSFKDWAEEYYMEYTDDWELYEWEEAYEESPWYNSTAPDIDWRKRVEIQGIVQRYITHSISSTINLDNDVTQEEIADIYIEAWKQGNKGQTIYRDGCRDGVLNKITDEEESTNSFNGCCEAPKRPHELEADYYQIKVNGELFSIVVGLYNNKPYEVFAFKPKINVKIEPHKGIITKVEKNHYQFNSDFLEIENLELTAESEVERATTLFASMLLRHGVSIRYIIKTARKINPIISSFSSALCRILSRYMEDAVETGEKCPECGGKILHEAGCIRCLDCDYSKCL